MIDDADIDKILISNNISFCKKAIKYFIGDKDNEKVKPLCTMLPKMNGYTKSFNETKYIFFLIKFLEIFGNLLIYFTNTNIYTNQVYKFKQKYVCRWPVENQNMFCRQAPLNIDIMSMINF